MDLTLTISIAFTTKKKFEFTILMPLCSKNCKYRMLLAKAKIFEFHIDLP